MKRDLAYVQHILDMIVRIETAADIGKEAFIGSRLHQDAVLRNLHTLTETTQRLSADLKEANPDIPWKTLAAFRNVLVHDYLGIDMSLIWTIVSRDIPDLKDKMAKIMSTLR